MKSYHSFGRSAIPAFLVTILIGITPGCDMGVPLKYPSPQSITVSKTPDKTVYEQGEDMDPTGLEVTVIYLSGGTRALSVEPADISGYDSETLGEQTLTVTISGKTAGFTVTVKARLESIAITSGPTRTEYEQGEDLDLSGLVVTGTYSDETAKPETVDLSNISGYNPNTEGTQTLTATLWGRTADFTVTVTDAVLKSIAVTSLPTKTVYNYGETLDIGGLVVTGTYSDWTTRAEPVTLANISGPNLDSSEYKLTGAVTQTLTVTVGRPEGTFTATFR